MRRATTAQPVRGAAGAEQAPPTGALAVLAAVAACSASAGLVVSAGPADLRARGGPAASRARSARRALPGSRSSLTVALAVALRALAAVAPGARSESSMAPGCRGGRVAAGAAAPAAAA